VPVHPRGASQTNGVVERVQETILEECWKPAFAPHLIPEYTGLRLDLERDLRYYNTDPGPHRTVDQNQDPRGGPGR